MIEIREEIFLYQFEVDNPESALRKCVASLPYDDGKGPFDEELDWLQEIASGSAEVTLHPIGHCINTWMWLEGSRFEPQYLSYIIKTDVSE